MAGEGRDLLDRVGRARAGGISSGSEIVGIGASETEMKGMVGVSSAGVSLTGIEGGFGIFIVGTIGAEAVDSGM